MTITPTFNQKLLLSQQLYPDSKSTLQRVNEPDFLLTLNSTADIRSYSQHNSHAKSASCLPACQSAFHINSKLIREVRCDDRCLAWRPASFASWFKF